MKEVIGYFRATNGTRRKHVVFITQVIDLDKDNTIIDAKKMFTLDSEEGEQVFRTGDPEIFTMGDGTELKRAGRIEELEK